MRDEKQYVQPDEPREIGKMKKVLLLSMLVLSFALYGCSAPSNNDKKISDLITYFKQAGFGIEDEGTMSYSLIGAEGGVGLNLNGGSVEIYKYNTNIPAQKRMLDSIKQSGLVQSIFPIPAKVNGSFVLIVSDLPSPHPDKDKILKLFSKF